jgi:hypothetical protein
VVPLSPELKAENLVPILDKLGADVIHWGHKISQDSSRIIIFW